jgi:hypothetical protein
MTVTRLCAPDGDAELLAQVLAIWREVLGRPDVGEDDDFFRLGGQSIVAASALKRMRGLVGFRIPLDALLSAPTPRQFTECLLVLRAEAERG